MAATTKTPPAKAAGSGPPGRHGFSDTGRVSVRIRRVTTTRSGGFSVPPFDTFNLGDHVGDDPAAVAANRARLTAAIGLDADRVVWMNQVHGDRVEMVAGPQSAAVGGRVGTDALVTTIPRLALAVVTADCVPVLLADARAGVVAAVHAGRVGAQLGVVVRAVEAMLAQGARPDDISALLGPAVSGRNYEVPAAMADEVEATLPGSRTTTAAGTPGLDLRAGIACQLRELGVTSIDIDPRCTVADPTLFSHRRDAPTGRLASLVWME
jgi:purine-nucleoside/S-methyl-5'-thioadenosine phosphorylase / adenosine deaminase